ncbi:hypothetical protein KCV06_g58, partial [Aureobasidium melanogenum]
MHVRCTSTHVSNLQDNRTIIWRNRLGTKTCSEDSIVTRCGLVPRSHARRPAALTIYQSSWLSSKFGSILNWRLLASRPLPLSAPHEKQPLVLVATRLGLSRSPKARDNRD